MLDVNITKFRFSVHKSVMTLKFNLRIFASEKILCTFIVKHPSKTIRPMCQWDRTE